jgi:hypothetical protein
MRIRPMTTITEGPAPSDAAAPVVEVTEVEAPDAVVGDEHLTAEEAESVEAGDSVQEEAPKARRRSSTGSHAKD